MNKIKEIYECLNNEDIHKALDLICKNEDELNEKHEFWNAKGIICIKAKEYATGLECFKRAVSMDKNNIDYLYNMAYLYELMNDYGNAYELYGKLKNKIDDNEFKEEIITYMEEINPEKKGIIIKNTDSRNSVEFKDNIYLARNNVVESMIDEEAPLVSVCVLAYNNLEKYTKRCVESVLQYTKDIDHELILVDNGSEDGTFEYFKTINHSKKKIVRITKNIGATYGGYQCYLNCKGRYVVFVANDLIVTKNWLSNMLKCIMSDEKIGMVNPMADYVSNYQSVNLNYINYDDMQIKAAEYNVSNPSLWEERVRLITLGTLYKKECLDIIGFMDYGFFHDFGDDDITFRVRRAGYKAMLCRDTFICHAGKITDKGAEVSRKSLEKGRKIFKDKYKGLDAWDDVQYELNLVNLIEYTRIDNSNTPKILGVDVKCGQPLLDIKNKLRSNGVMNSKLSAFVTEAKYYTDLCSICDEKVYVDRIEYLEDYFEDGEFDLVLIGNPINQYNYSVKILKRIMNLLKKNGQMLIKLRNSKDIYTLFNILGADVPLPKCSNITIEEVNDYVDELGFVINNVTAEFHYIDESTENTMKELVHFIQEDAKEKVLINNYLISIARKE